MDKLKPCPFCNGRPYYTTEYDGDGMRKRFIECFKCHARSAVHYAEEDCAVLMDTIENEWNRRDGE